MALSRSMKNMMHDAAQARSGGGNPNPTGGNLPDMTEAIRGRGTRYNPGEDRARVPGDVSGRLPGQRAGLKTKLMQAREGAGGGLRRAMERGGAMGGQYNPGPKLRPRAPMPDRGPRGPVAPAGGGRASRVSQAMKKARGGGIVEKLAAGGANRGAMTSKVMDRFNQARGGKPTPGGGTFGFAAQRGGTPAMQQATGGALAKPRGQAVAQRVAGRQGPPARRGGMARALGSGGSRRRLMR